MTFESIMVTLAALNTAGVFGLLGAHLRWVMRVERRMTRVETKLWPDARFDGLTV